MKIAIIGFGLMGASLARALLRAEPDTDIIAITRSEATRQKAIKLGLCSKAAADITAIPKNCDFVVLAAPVSVNLKLFDPLLKQIGPNTLITDLGSTKSQIVKYVQDHHPDFTRFIPAHPMAGAEKSGIDHSLDTLYDDRMIILVPMETNTIEALDKTRALYEMIGGKVQVMTSADDHDQVLSAVSHVPHLLAFAFMNMVKQEAQSTGSIDYLSVTGGGFRDFSRIAASDPIMWRDIFFENKENILEQVETLLAYFEQYREAMIHEDADKLVKLITEARDERRKLDNKD